MAQVKIYGREDYLRPLRAKMSTTIHTCAVEALRLPPEKRFHRFFPLESDDFVFPDDRSERYTIVEISMFSGRSAETKKRLINSLYARFEADLDIPPRDLEITIFESPRHDWGIRGKPGDELALDYQVDV